MLGYTEEEIRELTSSRSPRDDLLEETLSGPAVVVPPAQALPPRRRPRRARRPVGGAAPAPDGTPIHFISQILDVTAAHEYAERLAETSQALDRQRRYLEADRRLGRHRGRGARPRQGYISRQLIGCHQQYKSRLAPRRPATAGRRGAGDLLRPRTASASTWPQGGRVLRPAGLRRDEPVGARPRDHFGAVPTRRPRARRCRHRVPRGLTAMPAELAHGDVDRTPRLRARDLVADLPLVAQMDRRRSALARLAVDLAALVVEVGGHRAAGCGRRGVSVTVERSEGGLSRGRRAPAAPGDRNRWATR